MRVPRGTDYKYSKRCLINNVPLNLTSAYIVLTVKNTRDGDILFQKKNDVAGGSTSEIEVVSATDGLILIKIDRSDTLSLTRRDCFCDLYINIGTADYIIMYERFILVKTALQGDESIIGGGESASKYLRYLATNASTLTRQAGRGWSTEPTLSFSSTNIHIASADGELTLGKTFIELSNLNIDHDENGSGSSTASLAIIKPIAADYPFTINVFVY